MLLLVIVLVLCWALARGTTSGYGSHSDWVQCTKEADAMGLGSGTAASVWCSRKGQLGKCSDCGPYPGNKTAIDALYKKCVTSLGTCMNGPDGSESCTQDYTACLYGCRSCSATIGE